MKVKKKNKKHEMGYFYSMSPGNPEYNANAFNQVNMGALSESQKKNEYEIKYIPRNDDTIITSYIEAYSEKQAALLFRKNNKNIYRIVSIVCIENNEDGEQLSLFETADNLTEEEIKGIVEICLRIQKAENAYPCPFGLVRANAKNNSSKFNLILNQISDAVINKILNDNGIISGKSGDKYFFL